MNEKTDDLRQTFQDGIDRMGRQADSLLELTHQLDEAVKERYDLFD